MKNLEQIRLLVAEAWEIAKDGFTDDDGETWVERTVGEYRRNVRFYYNKDENYNPRLYGYLRFETFEFIPSYPNVNEETIDSGNVAESGFLADCDFYFDRQ